MPSLIYNLTALERSEAAAMVSTFLTGLFFRPGGVVK